MIPGWCCLKLKRPVLVTLWWWPCTDVAHLNVRPAPVSFFLMTQTALMNSCWCSLPAEERVFYCDHLLIKEGTETPCVIMLVQPTSLRDWLREGRLITTSCLHTDRRLTAVLYSCWQPPRGTVKCALLQMWSAWGGETYFDLLLVLLMIKTGSSNSYWDCLHTSARSCPLCRPCWQIAW